MSTSTSSTFNVFEPCLTDDELHTWLLHHVRIDVPRIPVCPHHCAPFDYIKHAYNEPARDVVVWAPRGGGKTRLAAAATLLDMLHKPGVSIRILGGSLDQAMRLWDHLLPDLERLAGDRIIGKPGARRTVKLNNGSCAAVLTQSQRAVRGLRVQKLRCDEVELFKPDIWEAAQLVTRSHPKASGAIEAISTLHAPYGLMSRIAERAVQQDIPVVRWCLLEVLERCPQERDCATCPLWEDCRGIAKTRCDGFVSIDDAIAMKARVSAETWDAEMMCRKPNVRGCVFPSFDESVHVIEGAASQAPGPRELSLAIDFGFANPFVCLWILTSPGDGVVHVIDEYVQEQRQLHEHVEQIRARPWGEPRWVACDPAGGTRNDQTARSNKQVLKSSGFTIRSRHSRIIEGIDTIRAALRPASGPPRLFVHPRCVRLIRALRSYRYPDSGGELPLKDGEHDHPIDALRYHFVNREAAPMTSRSY
jgi:hypothetical protein